MLSKAHNDLITQTGPGTPCGEFLRSYWQPIAAADEMPPGGAPLPIRIMSEDLVLFRSDDGELGLIGQHCPHRGTDLSYGRVEDGGLRCLYHGWLWDAQGRCLEQPGEPAGSTFHERVRHTAYPCLEAGGMILAYLGPGAPPALPPYELFAVPDAHRWATKIFHECSYLQANEGNIDPQHLSFLHRQFDESGWRQYRVHRTVPGSEASSMSLFQRDVAPTIEVEETDFGVRIYSVRKTSPERNYVRISNFVLPNAAAFPGRTEGDGYQMHWHVPIDDTHHWKYTFIFSNDGPIDREGILRGRADVTPDYRPIYNRSNRYGQDRASMRNGSYSGMRANFQVHDLFATECAGPIQDRTREHLAVSDRPIIEARKMMLAAIKDVQEGRDPPGVVRDPVQNRFPRIATTYGIIPSDVDWKTHCDQLAREKGTSWLTRYAVGTTAS
jgi:phthalate 4,5-dioxygenase